MADAAVACDPQVIEREAHTLKSSASTFGAVRLAELAPRGRMERTCRTETRRRSKRMSGRDLRPWSRRPPMPTGRWA